MSSDQQTYDQFLNELLSSEQQERRRKSWETRLKLARLPYRKTLEDFDFSFQPSIDKRQVDELAALAFVARHENVIFLGPPGVGKTHLAIGLAIKALDAGMTVYCTSLSHMVTDLKKAPYSAAGESICALHSSSSMRLDIPNLTARRQSYCSAWLPSDTNAAA